MQLVGKLDHIDLGVLGRKMEGGTKHGLLSVLEESFLKNLIGVSVYDSYMEDIRGS